MRSLVKIVRLVPVFFILFSLAGLAALLWARIGRTVEAAGEIRISRYQVVRPKVSGIVGEVAVEPGDRVLAGQTLVRLVDYDFERQRLAVRQQLHDARLQVAAVEQRRGRLENEVYPLETAKQAKELASVRLEDEASVSRTRESESELERAEETLGRIRELREAGVVSTQSLAAAHYDREQARERFEQSKIARQLAHERLADALGDGGLLAAEHRGSLADLAFQAHQLLLLVAQLDADLEHFTKIAEAYELRAEIDGIVVAEAANDLRGRKVEPGQDLLSIIDLEAVHFLTYVPESAILKVRSGQAAYVELTGLPRRSFDVFAGEVQKVAEEPQLQPSATTILYPVEIRLHQPWVVWEGNRFYVRSGMRGQAKIAYRSDVSLLRAIYESLAGEPGLAEQGQTASSRPRDAPIGVKGTLEKTP